MFVYKHYDQDQLDRQFNNRLHVPDFQEYFNRWELLSRHAEKKLPITKDVPYGDLPREKLDIFPSSQPRSKTLVFIHGGYWQMLDKAMFRFIANGFHSYNISLVLLSYPLAPEAPVDELVVSCKRAIVWLYNHIDRYNGDHNKLYIAGHSAGGHLAAMLMATDWKSISAELPQNLVKGICAISGLFNLVPVHLSYLNKVLKLTHQTAVQTSPVNLEPVNLCPLIVTVGEMETAEFNDQSKELAEAWKDKGFEIDLLQIEQLNHFSIIETIIDPDSILHKQVRQLMEI